MKVGVIRGDLDLTLEAFLHEVFRHWNRLRGEVVDAAGLSAF